MSKAPARVTLWVAAHPHGVPADCRALPLFSSARAGHILLWAHTSHRNIYEGCGLVQIAALLKKLHKFNADVPISRLLRFL